MDSSSLVQFLSSRSDVEPVDPSEVPEIVRQTVIYQYFQVAILTVLVYDTIITFDKEVKYFWKIPRKPVDFVYFVNRYTGIWGVSAFLCTHSAWTSLSNFGDWTHIVINWITVILIDYILTIRVLALYSQNEKHSTRLYMLLGLEAAFKFALFIYGTLLAHNVVIGLAKGVTACSADGVVPWYWALVGWIVPLLYGVILMILALYKATEYWRLSAGFKGFTLVRVLIEDQIIYFSTVIFCSVFAILSFKIEMQNLFSGRMLFNLKEAGERGQNEGTTYIPAPRAFSVMKFAEAGPVNPGGEHEPSMVVHEGQESDEAVSGDGPKCC